MKIVNKFNNNTLKIVLPSIANHRDHTPEQEELFESLEPGDVVYAKMPVSAKELKNIPEGHEVRPYLIVEKTDTELVTYPSYSKYRDLENRYYLQYEFNSFKYDLHRSDVSYFRLDEAVILGKRYLIKKYASLDHRDMQQIERTLVIKENNTGVKAHRFHIQVPSRPGDIVRADLLWLITDVKNDIASGYQLFRGIKEMDHKSGPIVNVEAKGKNYNINLKHYGSIPVMNYPVLIGTFPSGTMEYIQERQIYYLKLHPQISEILQKKNKTNLLDGLSYKYKTGTILIGSNFKEYLYIYSLYDEMYVVDMETINNTVKIRPTVLNSIERRKVTPLTHLILGDYRKILRKNIEFGNNEEIEKSVKKRALSKTSK